MCDASVDRSGTASAAASESTRMDKTFLVALQVGIDHPYLLSDVEVLNRERVNSIRDSLAKECRKVWQREAKGEGCELEPLPEPAQDVGGTAQDVGGGGP